MANWNPASPESWAALLGMTSAPMFSKGRTPAHVSDHAVLLDGPVASIALLQGDAERLCRETDPLSWSWSSHLRRVFIRDSQSGKLFLRRWYAPNDTVELGTPTESHLVAVVDSPDGSEPADNTVISRMLETFRVVRRNIEDMGGTPLDVMHTFNALLVATDAVRSGGFSKDEWPDNATLKDALTLINRKRLAPLDPDRVSKSVLGFWIWDLVKALLDKDAETGYNLDPDLLIRHAAGYLYQEAHVELARPLFRQRALFPSLVSGTSPTGGTPKRDVHFTPPSLARALVEEAFSAMKQVRGLPNRVEVLDPACGSGEFLIESLREFAARGVRDFVLRGIDTSDVSCAMTEFALWRVASEEPAARTQTNLHTLTADSLKLASWGSPDFIFMNPPFTAWDAMSGEERSVVRTELSSLYFGRPDKAMAFVHKAIASLKPGAVLASLVPAPFLESHAAVRLRAAIGDDPSLRIHLLGRFRGFGYFPGATVEPAFFIVSRGETVGPESRPVRVVLAQRKGEDRAIRELRKEKWADAIDPLGRWEVYSTDQAAFSSASWMPKSRRSIALFEKLADKDMPRMRDLFHVRLGVRTGAQRVFVVSPQALEAWGASEAERRLFRPIAGNSTIRAGRLEPGNLVFYPYGPNGVLFASDDELRTAAPRFFENRLLPNRDKLTARLSVRGPWWNLSEPRLTWQPKFKPKIVAACFGDIGSFAYDEGGNRCVVQGFAWLWRRERFHTAKLPWAYLALLNSGFFELLLSHFCPRMRGGQFDLYPKFADDVFLPDLSRGSQSPSEAVSNLAEMGRQIANGSVPESESLDLVVSHVYGVPLEDLRGRPLPQPPDYGAIIRFHELAKLWIEETAHLSNPRRIYAHPAFKAISEMGDAAIPLALAELRRQPGAWPGALQQLTGVNPVPLESQGVQAEMVEAWLSWGRRKRLQNMNGPRVERIEKTFPAALSLRYGKTSSESSDYNCIAWAAGDTTRVWQPVLGYWPPGVNPGLDISDLIAMFAGEGYEECAERGPDVEVGFEKVALYGHLKPPDWEHAARQVRGGWTSKIGAWEDIWHARPEALAGSEYGFVWCYMKRPGGDGFQISEQEWLGGGDLGSMVAFMRGRVSGRKLRLWACACCRRIWNSLPAQLRHTVFVAECFADGSVPRSALAESDRVSSAVEADRQAILAAKRAVAPLASMAALAYRHAALLAPSGCAAETALQVALLRDIVGPTLFHKVEVDPAWQAPAIIALLREIVRDGTFGRLPEIAPLLKAHSCANSEILDHCSLAEGHVRGCWVVDLLLGKS